MLGAPCSPCCGGCTQAARESLWSQIAAMPCSVTLTGSLPQSDEATIGPSANFVQGFTEESFYREVAIAQLAQAYTTYVAPSSNLAGTHALSLDLGMSTLGQVVSFSHSTDEYKISARVVISGVDTATMIVGSQGLLRHGWSRHGSTQCFVTVLVEITIEQGVASSLGINQAMSYAHWQAIATNNLKKYDAPTNDYFMFVSDVSPQYIRIHSSAQGWWSESESQYVSMVNGLWDHNVLGLDVRYGDYSYVYGQTEKYTFGVGNNTNAAAIQFTGNSIVATFDTANETLSVPKWVDAASVGMAALKPSPSFSGTLQASGFYRPTVTYSLNGSMEFQYHADAYSFTPTVVLG